MIQAIRGTKDILPNQINYWHFLENAFRNVSKLYAYKELRTPIFEKTEVFSRSIGEATDIVNKEMYTFIDKGGESVTLRPEMTASLVRSVIQNSLAYDVSTLRLWYFGPFFRYERPQKGRLRQFHQFGAECISSPFPESDAEVIMLANHLIRNIGIDDYILEINSLGNDSSREKYRTELVKYLNDNQENLSEDSRIRLESNPLRVLDSKDYKDRLVIANAPVIIDFLDSESSEHFARVKELIENAGIKYEIQPQLVRGLDYYSHTVFEFRSNVLGAQDAFGGGGRYDGLFTQLGGKKTPAVGFAMGVERLILILETLNKLEVNQSDCDIFVLCNGNQNFSYSNKIAEILRLRGFSTIVDLQRRSFKAQMRESDKLKSKYCIIIGDDEVSKNSLTIKNMTNSEQTEISSELINSFKFN
jgi:histidyl-tRNA synthetase